MARLGVFDSGVGGLAVAFAAIWRCTVSPCSGPPLSGQCTAPGCGIRSFHVTYKEVT